MKGNILALNHSKRKTYCLIGASTDASFGWDLWCRSVKYVVRGSDSVALLRPFKGCAPLES